MITAAFCVGLALGIVRYVVRKPTRPDSIHCPDCDFTTYGPQCAACGAPR